MVSTQCSMLACRVSRLRTQRQRSGCFLPPVIPKRQNSTGQQVRAPARIPESGSLHEATK